MQLSKMIEVVNEHATDGESDGDGMYCQFFNLHNGTGLKVFENWTMFCMSHRLQSILSDDGFAPIVWEKLPPFKYRRRGYRYVGNGNYLDYDMYMDGFAYVTDAIKVLDISAIPVYYADWQPFVDFRDAFNDAGWYDADGHDENYGTNAIDEVQILDMGGVHREGSKCPNSIVLNFQNAMADRGIDVFRQ